MSSILTRATMTILLTLAIWSNAFAADTLLCVDTDKDGAFSIIKDSGVIDRDCDHNASVADGGTDCDDTDNRVFDGGWSTVGCGAGEVRYCDAGVYKTKPGGGTSGSPQGCSTDPIDEGKNNYYTDASGSGTTCSNASPCNLTAVATGGAVTPVSPYTIIIKGTTNFTNSSGYAFAVAGSSAGNKSSILQDPRSTALINPTGGSCSTSCASIVVNAANILARQLKVTGGDSTGSGAIRLNANNTGAIGNRIYDAVCNNNFNCAGIYGGENLTNFTITNNNVVDVYDPTRTTAAGDRQNVYLISIFQGLAHELSSNSVGYSRTPNTSPYEVQGGGIRIKHGLPTASCDETSATHSYLRRNVIGNTEFPALFTSSGCSSIEENLVLGSSHGITVGPGGGGGTAAWHDIQVKKNTIVTGPHWSGNSVVQGAIDIGGDATEVTVGGVAFSDNVVDDSAQTSYGGGNNIGLIVMTPYGSDANFEALIFDSPTSAGIMTFGNNCYWNSNVSGLTTGFSFHKETSGGSAGPLGSAVNFTNVKLTPYFFETTSTNGNMALDNEYRVTAVCPVGSIGWESGWPEIPPTPTPTPTPTPESNVTPGGTSRVAFGRRGGK